MASKKLKKQIFHALEDSPDFEEKWWAGKSEVKEIRGLFKG